MTSIRFGNTLISKHKLLNIKITFVFAGIFNKLFYKYLLFSDAQDKMNFFKSHFYDKLQHSLYISIQLICFLKSSITNFLKRIKAKSILVV